MSRLEPTGLLQAFSTLVLDLQRLAQHQEIEHFQPQALARISQLLPFDCAWWGRSAVIDNLPEEHSSCLYQLPPGYLTDWQSIRHVDVTFGRSHATPGQAVIIDMRDPGSGAGLNWLGERYGIGQLLCVIHIAPHTCLSDHLTLYRKPGAPGFTAQDCLLLDNLMLHLVAAVSANQIRTLVAMRETLSNPRNLALAVCDARGVLQCAERGFVDLLLSEWPGWSGPTLPVPVDERGYEGKHIHLQVWGGAINCCWPHGATGCCPSSAHGKTTLPKALARARRTRKSPATWACRPIRCAITSALSTASSGSRTKRTSHT